MIITFSACDDMLDLDPVSEIAADSYYQNGEQINIALMGVYNGLQTPLQYEWMFTELRSDNAYQKEVNSSNDFNHNLDDLDMFRPNPTIPEIKDYWYYSYQNIASANRVISEVGVVADETLRAQYEGEARFIRAYHYFNLVRLFGPVFITTEAISPLEAKKKTRSSVESVYEVIISDLMHGSENLPAKYDADQKGRITNWAAKTMLAKVYMTLHKYNLAKPLLEDVKNNSDHQLLGIYKDVFSIDNELNDEIIFTVRYKAGGYGLGSPFANNFAASQSRTAIVTGDGDGYNYPSNSLVASYEDGDQRKSVTVGYYTRGQKNYVTKFLSPINVKYDGENDFPILRYSDVILLLAEVYNEEGTPSTALPLVNEIRDRAGLPALDNGISQTACRLAIEKERRIEFAFENQRWYDLVRTGRAKEVVKEQIASLDWDSHYNGYPDAKKPVLENIVQDWQLLLPIPQSEIDTNNDLFITQNLGY